MDADEARQATARIRTTASELRRDIFDFNARLGWRALGYGSFRDWAAAELDQSIRHTYRQLAAAEAEIDLGETIGHIPEAHLRPMAGIPVEDRAAVWARANKLAGEEARTAAHVAQAVAEYDSLVDALADLQKRAKALGLTIERRERSLDGALAMILCGPEPEVERSYPFDLTAEGQRDIASETTALIALNTFLTWYEEQAFERAETLTPFEARIAEQHEQAMVAQKLSVLQQRAGLTGFSIDAESAAFVLRKGDAQRAFPFDARSDGSPDPASQLEVLLYIEALLTDLARQGGTDAPFSHDWAPLRAALLAGPHRWPEAEQIIAAMPTHEQAPWLSDFNQLRRIDADLRARKWQTIQRLINNISDAELREREIDIVRGAVRELALPWPFSNGEHSLGIACGTPANKIPDTWDEWRRRAQAIGLRLTLGLHGVFTVSASDQGNIYSGSNWIEAIGIIRTAELRGGATGVAEPNNEAYIEELRRRASACGYEMRLGGKGAIRWLKNGQPWGGSKSLNDAEMQICTWENQKHQVVRSQAQPDASHDTLYAQYEQQLAGVLERLGDTGAKLLAITMFPDEEGDPAEILWENWTTAAENLSTEDLRRALGVTASHESTV